MSDRQHINAYEALAEEFRGVAYERSTPRYCVTCRYAKRNPPAGLPMACFHPLSTRDPVNGWVEICAVMRGRSHSNGGCGTMGELWEQRDIPAPRPSLVCRLSRVIRRAFSS
jgi:hypothetical protein